jgi:hypothetical protein
MACGLTGCGGAMLTTLDFEAGLEDVRDMAFSFRLVRGVRRRDAGVAPLGCGNFGPGLVRARKALRAAVVRERSDPVPSRTVGALLLQSGACSDRRPAHTAPTREERHRFRHARRPVPKGNKRRLTIHQSCYDIRAPQRLPRADMHKRRCPRCRSGATGQAAIAIASHGEKARFAITFRRTALAEWPIIELHLEQARLPGTWHGLSLCQGDEFAPRITPALDHDGAWQVQ